MIVCVFEQVVKTSLENGNEAGFLHEAKVMSIGSIKAFTVTVFGL